MMRTAPFFLGSLASIKLKPLTQGYPILPLRGRNLLEIFAGRNKMFHSCTLLLLLLLLPLDKFFAAEHYPFSEHETLEYQVKWDPPAWMFFMPEINAGKIVFKVVSRSMEKNIPIHRFEGQAVSTSSLVKVNDAYQSTARGNDLCSEWTKKIVHEGKRHREVELRVEGEKKAALVTEKDIAVNPPKIIRNETLKDFPSCVNDLLAGAYRARSFPLKPGETYRLILTDNGKYHEVSLRPLQKETIQTPAGTFSTQKVEVLSFLGGLVKQKGTFYIWFADDARHLPVRFDMKVRLGHIHGFLTRVQE
ncbi:MAG: DUF3108 domain-containing protein [Acidobacteriia bacterium]|nr:DUF3108 domain-containing protein [Terriglobia bacterium]